MQQTADVAVKETKDLDSETIPAYGLSYFCSAVAADAVTDGAAIMAAETTVSGLSSFFAAVAALADAVTTTAADATMDSETAAASLF